MRSCCVNISDPEDIPIRSPMPVFSIIGGKKFVVRLVRSKEQTDKQGLYRPAHISSKFP